MTLLGTDRLLAPLREALTDVPADEADIHVHRRRAAITRYSHSSIHQNAVSDETHATVRAIVGQAVGIVTTNSPPGLRVVRRPPRIDRLDLSYHEATFKGTPRERSIPCAGPPLGDSRRSIGRQ